jgi:alpha-N-acetylglucosamine transferase
VNAFVTLVTNDDYALGALALIRSLKLCHSTAPLVVLATRAVDGLEALASEGARIIEVDPLPVSDEFRAGHARPALHAAAPFTKGTKPVFHDPLDNFAKLRLWQLVELDRAVFLDADTLVVRNIDRLFGYPELCAASL